jgi:ACS family sodium-dependent inorganic phosphate cotransporter
MPGLRSPGSAVVCASVALGACALSRAGFAVNHLDIAPKYAGVVMGVSNTAGTVAGIVGVTVTGRILEGSALGASDPSSWYMVFATPALLLVVSALFFLVFATGERIFD